MFQILFLLYFTVAAIAKEAVEVLQFDNFGYSGAYSRVSKLSDIYKDSCSCEVDSTQVTFSGANTPLNEEVSVHFRGPLILNRFGSYVSDSFTLGDDSSGDWTRLSYYEASSGTSENVTFLTRAGKNSSCLGYGLTYASDNGTGAADSSTVLAENTLINSNDEYVIFSNISCESSGLNNDCGVYRSDIPAYHGFYGTTKMFLFEFKMPNETKTSTKISNYNMPAIWLLNAQIPRTAQYSQNVNCSCWRSGCGEFDIFEVMNSTEYLHLYSTVHDYQGTDDIETGMAIDSYIERDLTGTMVGGVVFDSNGDVTVWVSNSTSFDETVAGSDVNQWVNKDSSAATTTLSSVSLALTTASGSSSSKKGEGFAYKPSTLLNLLAAVLVYLI
ncbi:Pga52 protein [Candida orthopsilosis Co 90-125]|uniref:glucan endo-1,3-beta-D-glucosidase n=1 Tax=Candida orthopsilosis (strain 90-125) TaxID=1136231 RepID=H8WZ51_CANO9|nr:Pga52 protein [Candida orthopsilosis Co 90-125]CCG21683.1 Pga52 protein [Candida orthopsilosis Co 90-125]